MRRICANRMMKENEEKKIIFHDGKTDFHVDGYADLKGGWMRNQCVLNGLLFDVDVIGFLTSNLTSR